MDLNQKVPPDLTFEVKTDPWALGRLHEPSERDDLIALGFTHTGYQFSVIAGSSWERGQVGLTSEVLTSEDKTAQCTLELFFDYGLLTLRTLLGDGTIIITRYVPEDAEFDAIAWMIFGSRPLAGRYAETIRTWDAEAAWQLHRDRVAEVATRVNERPVDHDMTVNLAMDCRGVQIAHLLQEAMGRAMRGVAFLAFVLIGATAVAFWFASPMVMMIPIVLIAALPMVLKRIGLNIWMPRREKPDAVALCADPWVTERLGDHVPLKNPFKQAPESVRNQLKPGD